MAPDKTDIKHILAKVAPLSPTLAVRIFPQIDPSAAADPTLSHCRYVNRSAKRKEVRAVNTLIVRAAENLVFHQGERPRIHRFVRKHARYRMDVHTTRIPTGDGEFVMAQRRIKPVDACGR